MNNLQKSYLIEVLKDNLGIVGNDDEIRQILNPDGEAECFLAGVKLGMLMTGACVMHKHQEEQILQTHVKGLYERFAYADFAEDILDRFYPHEEPDPLHPTDYPTPF